MKEQEEITHFIKGQKMGIEILKLFKKKTSDISIINELNSSIEVYEARLKELLELYRNSYNMSEPDMTFFQKRAIFFAKMELMTIKTDRKLIRYIAKTVSMGTTGALKFLEKVENRHKERISLYKQTVQDYLNTYTKFSSMLLVD